MFLRKFFGGFVKFFLVPRKLFGEVGPQRVIRLRLVDEGYEALDHLIRLRRRLPILRRDDGQADLSLFVDVGMIDFSFERDFGRFERILGREVDLDPEGSLVVRCAVGNDKALPAQNV